MQYKIQIEKQALKFIQKQDRPQRERILAAIAHLPLIGDIKPLVNRPGYFRLRVGDYRVIYTVDNDVLTVFVVKVGNRGEIYK